MDRCGNRCENSQRRERVSRKARKKVKNSRNTVFFPMCWGSKGSKSRLAKAADAEPSGRMRNQKLPAAVVVNPCRRQKAKNTSGSGHFWRVNCRKIARGCGTKHIPKSKDE